MRSFLTTAIFCIALVNGGNILNARQISAKDTLHVLFIGNSYTYGNDLPEIVWEFVTSKGTPMVYMMVAPGGATLNKNWRDGIALKKIIGHKWDFVVLQDQSMQPISLRDSLFHFARLFNEKITKTGAKTVLYMTWAREGRPADQEKLTEAYRTIGKELGCLVVPVGEAWKIAISQGFKLHWTDGSHANTLGSYVAGCAFYHAFTGKSSLGLREILYRENANPLLQISRQRADSLQKIVEDAWAQQTSNSISGK